MAAAFRISALGAPHSKEPPAPVRSLLRVCIPRRRDYANQLCTNRVGLRNARWTKLFHVARHNKTRHQTMSRHAPLPSRNATGSAERMCAASKEDFAIRAVTTSRKCRARIPAANKTRVSCSVPARWRWRTRCSAIAPGAGKQPSCAPPPERRGRRQRCGRASGPSTVERKIVTVREKRRALSFVPRARGR